MMVCISVSCKMLIIIAIKNIYTGSGPIRRRPPRPPHRCICPPWWCAVFFGLELWCWVGWARGSLLATALLPIFFWLVTVNVMHDASHFAFASRPWINELCAMTGAPLLCESITWYHQHVMSHHTHANEVAGDVDLQHMVPLKLHSQACFLPAA